MREVSKAEFFAKIYTEKLDVVGGCYRNSAGEYEITWKIRHTGQIIGRSVTDYRGAVNKNRFYLREESA